MSIDEKVFKMEIIGKEEEGRKGLIFRKPEYVIAFRIVDDRVEVIENPTFERTVPFHQYSSVRVGDFVDVSMYTYDQERWFLSAKEAEQHQRYR